MASVRAICPVLLVLSICCASGGLDFAKCKPAADIVFVVDSSDNIGEQRFLAIREFLATFVRLIEDKVDKNHIRMAAVTFSATVELEFNLADCPLAEDLVGQNWLWRTGSRKLGGCFGNMRYRGGTQSTLSTALKRIRESVFSVARPGVPKIAFVITDQLAEDMHEEIETEIAQLKRVGVQITRLIAKDQTAVRNSVQLSTVSVFPTEVNELTLWTQIAHHTCSEYTGQDHSLVKRSGHAPAPPPVPALSSLACSSFPLVPHAQMTSCSNNRSENSVCIFSCNEGFQQTSSTMEKTCRNRGWEGDAKCEESCGWGRSHCWPGNCTDGLPRSCVCQPGFKPFKSGSAALCDLDTSPNLSTCRISVTSNSSGEHKNSSSPGTQACVGQQDEFIKFQPDAIAFTIRADLDLSLASKPWYISDDGAGVVGAMIKVVRMSVQGVETDVLQQDLDTTEFCQATVSDTHPTGTVHDCEGTRSIPVSAPNLVDGESFCVDMEAYAGGFYGVQDADSNPKSQQVFTRVPKHKRVCFTYDESRPVHCLALQAGCAVQPLNISARLTRTPHVDAYVEGWIDPIPAGSVASLASNITQYRLEVHDVAMNGSTLTVQDAAISEYTIEWDVEESNAGGPFDRRVFFPQTDTARLYAIILEVHDHAGNVAYARRLLLYDNSSSVELHDDKSLKVVTANPRSALKWQTNITTGLCVDWKNRFYNTDLYHNNFLKPVTRDTGREICGQYDQQTGVLPISGTDNVDGVTKFEMAWRCDDGPQSTFSEVTDVFAQTTCLYGETFLDGQTYDIWIRATDIMGNTNEDSVRVSIDNTGPVINIVGLRGRFGQDGLYVHNTTDLSAMLLVLQAEDPHSGLMTLQWTLGTQHLADDVGKRAVRVQRLDNATDCTGEEHCYCPSVGVCEVHQYLIQFNNLVDDNSHKGDHHRHYYITITSTNHASLQTTEHIEILVDDSPPTVGVVSEGLDDDDKAEMDFTSSSVVHVHWHGFRDHESGVLMYRVALAPRCLTLQELEDYENSTVLGNGQTTTSFQFPSEGHYFTTVVAYNGGMEPSDVSCSDGITYDTTPPRLVNVTLIHARSGQHVACTKPDEAWLVNSNMTRVRLASSQHCLTFCAQHFPTADPHYLPLSFNQTVDPQASDDFCRTLTVLREDWPIMLPSDYIRLAWQATDAESEMEEYYVGLGTDKTTAPAPDLLRFTPTHGHTSYHARHSGLGHDHLFYIFLRAVSKAGLHAEVTLGPVIIDVTPPDVTQTLASRVEGDYLVVTWNESTFVDLEQPVGVDLDVTFRVGYDNTFIGPFTDISENTSAVCQILPNRCASYPLSELYAHDTEAGRSFFFQLHVTNAAGHTTTVNSTCVPLPARLSPSHAVIFDAIKTKTDDNGNQSNAETESFSPILEDVDVIVQREEVCIAWHGLYHKDEDEVGIGTSPSSDDLISFTAVENKSPACVSVISLPVYDKLYSVVRATSPGGSAIFSSDGFRMIPFDDPANRLQVFTGRGCAATDIVGSQLITPGVENVDLTAISSVPLHTGDLIFVRLTPFIQHVQFPDTVVLQTTLTGYQLVPDSSHLTAVLPAPITANTTLQVMTCLKDAALSVPEDPLKVSLEIDGPWTKFIQRLKVQVVDNACMQDSQTTEEYKNQYCLIGETTASPTQTEVTFGKDSVVNGHQYVARVAACFDDACLPYLNSTPITMVPKQLFVVFKSAMILSQSPQDTEVDLTAQVSFSTEISSDPASPSCVFRWAMARDMYGLVPVTKWMLGQSASCSHMEVHERAIYTGAGQGTLYACLQPVFPWRSEGPTCHKLVRPEGLTQPDPWHVIEIHRSVFRETDFQEYLFSKQLGSKLHDLYDLDIDFARSDVLLSAVLTYSEGRNVTWFLMTNQHLPPDGDCAEDSDCITSLKDKTGTVMFPSAASNFQDGNVYFVCARLSQRPADLQNGDSGSEVHDVCGDGVVIDDTAPVGGSVTISNAKSGYLAGSGHVTVTWSGFSDVETSVTSLPDDITMSYSVSLGSYPGGEDLAHSIPVGQRTWVTFQQLNMSDGITVYATVKAEDRVGHVTEVWSDPVIADNTPPTVLRVAAGTITRQNFVPGPALAVFWEGVEDPESGIEVMEIAVSTKGGSDDVIPFAPCHGNGARLTDTSALVDGHFYVVLLKVMNRAGLATIASSEPFVIDSSPPGPGTVWNSAPNTTNHGTYSTDIGVYRVYWAGFLDPHSGLDFYRVGLGSKPNMTDIHPFVYVGQQTSYTWKRTFEQGKPYYVTVEACNKAGLCRMTTSSSMTFDDSPPTPGHVTVGFYGHHSKYHGHTSSLAVQWRGFEDPQCGIQEYSWCVGTAPESCDVMPAVMTSLSRATVRSGLALPTSVPLHVTVRARNPAGLDCVSVSDSFTVDPTPPEVVSEPHFLSPRDGHVTRSQWDRSVLRLAWQFRDPESAIVRHIITIRSNLTGRLVTDSLTAGADTELILTLEAENLLSDGETYYAAVTSCNAAGLCTTSLSPVLLVDSTPPLAGTLLSPLAWRRNSTSDPDFLVDVEWHNFADAESGINAYFVMAGRAYNGEELSGGQVRVQHDVTNNVQRHTLTLTGDIKPGDIIYLAVWTENTLGRHSPMLRTAFEVLQNSSTGTSGILVAVRHSCDVDYCTQECTCAPTGQVCDDKTAEPCQEYQTDHPDLGTFRLSAYMGPPLGLQTIITSAKCLEGHWQLSDPQQLANVSRFEWSFSLFNKSAGDGVIDTKNEAIWHDVGRNMSAIYCLPEKRMLRFSQSYILHVRAWLSSVHHVTFVSAPVLVDHTPPQIRRGGAIIDSDVMCGNDVDYVTTEPTITACWEGVFRDADSQIAGYEIWFGTSEYADDHTQKIHAGLRTNCTFPTVALEQGTRYHVTVRAENGAGLMTTAVSDGIIVDATPPHTGVVFAAHHYSHQPAQHSTSELPASWHGFQDMESGLASYQVAVHDVTDGVTEVVPFFSAGIQTEYTLRGLALEHNHKYKVVVKARDKAGLESEPVESRSILVDVTPPEGVTCNNYQLLEEKTLSYVSTSSFVHDSYVTDFDVFLPDSDQLMKLEMSGINTKGDEFGYMSLGERRMPVHFKYGQSGQATAELEFVAAGEGTIIIDVEAKPGSQIQSRLYSCTNTVKSEKNSVTVLQMSEFAVSVCARILDNESDIRSLLVGVGTTPGGLQVRPLTPVGHSSYSLVDVQLQHGLPVYATVHVENHAGQWSRFISQPITMDRTPPEVMKVKVTLRYEDQKTATGLLVNVTWRAEDTESGVVSCTCSLDGHSNVEDSVQQTTHVTPGFCNWHLSDPQHGSSVRATVSCVNGVQIHATETSDPATVLFHPPNLEQANVVSLPNNAIQSPFHASDLGVRSSDSSLEFCWHGVDDPTITQVHFRFLHESRPLTEWSFVDAYKTSAIFESRAQSGNFTTQVRAFNGRGMTSEIVSASVTVDDRKPSLTGQSARASLQNSLLEINWQDVFASDLELTFALYAGTAEGYGDVISHVITTSTSFQGSCKKSLNSIFVTILAVHTNGHSEVYSAELLL